MIRYFPSLLHTYALLEHPQEYPRTRVGEWRMVWKLPDDLLDTLCVDPLRYRRMPKAEDFRRAEPTGIKEIVKITSGVRAGMFECKHDCNACYHKTPFWGHADSRGGLGVWMVFGAHEWFSDGPPKQDLTLAIASADGARLDIHVNDGTRPVQTFTPPVQGGNALLREGIHAKYCLHRICIPAAALRAGNNTLSITQTRTHGPGLHVMYDYLALEGP